MLACAGAQRLSGAQDYFRRNGPVRGASGQTARVLRGRGAQGKIQETHLLRTTNGSHHELGGQ